MGILQERHSIQKREDRRSNRRNEREKIRESRNKRILGGLAIGLTTLGLLWGQHRTTVVPNEDLGPTTTSVSGVPTLSIDERERLNLLREENHKKLFS